MLYAPNWIQLLDHIPMVKLSNTLTFVLVHRTTHIEYIDIRRYLQFQIKIHLDCQLQIN